MEGHQECLKFVFSKSLHCGGPFEREAHNILISWTINSWIRIFRDCQRKLLIVNITARMNSSANGPPSRSTFLGRSLPYAVGRWGNHANSEVWEEWKSNCWSQKPGRQQGPPLPCHLSSLPIDSSLLWAPSIPLFPSAPNISPLNDRPPSAWSPNLHSCLSSAILHSIASHAQKCKSDHVIPAWSPSVPSHYMGNQF